MKDEKVNAILVVDDDELVRSFLSDALKLKKYRVTTAENGEVAISFLSNNEYDLLITDILMPGTSGVEVADYAFEKHPSMPIMAITAHGTIESSVTFMKRYQLCEYLSKPLPLDLLYKKVEELIATSKKIRATQNTSVEQNTTDEHLERDYNSNHTKIIQRNSVKLSKENYISLRDIYPYLIGGMVHDLKNSLVGIKGLYELEIENQGTRYSKSIKKAFARMSTFLKSMYEISALFYDEDSSIEYLCNMKITIKKIRKLMVVGDNIKIRTIGIKSLPILNIPEAVIMTIILEFIKNLDKISKKYSLKNKLVIKFEYDKKNKVLKIIFIDNGPGYPIEIIDSQPLFNRVGGLYFIFTIVERLGGGLSISNNTNGGARSSLFFEVLPYE